MPGFVIHIAVGKEYMKKHPDEIKNKEEFLEGVLAPDLIPKLNDKENKSNTHYGKWGNYNMIINLDKFLEDPKVDIGKDYWKGYFMHLLTDKEFYLDYFEEETEKVVQNKDNYYYDYDCLNKSLIEKFQIERNLNDNITKYMNQIEGTPKYLKVEKVIRFIEEIASKSIEEQIQLIK